MKILLVDDQETLCVPLARYIQQEAQRFLAEEERPADVVVTPVFTLADGIAAIKIEPQPDLVLLDLGLGGENQREATLERFQQANTDRIPVAVFTGLAPGEKGAVETYRKCIHKFGARGIIIKSSKLDKMFVGLNRMIHNEQWISEEVFMAMLDPSVPARDDSPPLGLTKRQHDVAKLLTKGLRTKEIARELGGLSPGHVTQIIGAVLEKLDVKNRTQAAMKLAQVSPRDLE